MKGTYNINLSYDQNYLAGPEFEGDYPDLELLNAGLPESYFLGFKVNSTLGIPAGPLLNSAYIKLYADLGWDILTYKTVRTRAQACHPFPNVCAVDSAPGWYTQAPANTRPALTILPTLDENNPPDQLSITNSFGMPSRPPEIWRQDVTVARKALHAGQLLGVSVVGSAEADSTLDDLAADFALAASWAADAGAHFVEANLSCPNVQGKQASLYQSPVAVAAVAGAISQQLSGKTPFLLKMGYLDDLELIAEIVKAAYDNGAAGLAAINTIPARVYSPNGQQALPGEGRLVSGICGASIKPAGLAMTRRLLVARQNLGIKSAQFAIVGVGGIMNHHDASDYLATGADGMQSGTGAMWQPYLASQYKNLLKAANALRATPGR